MGAVRFYGVVHYLYGGATISLRVGAVAAVLCLALFVCTAMIYACLKFLQEWHTTLTPVNYFLLGTASGFTLAAVLAALAAPHAIHQLAIAALVLGALAYLGRLAALRRNARLRPMSTLATAIGVKHPRIEQKAQGFMGGSFNTPSSSTAARNGAGGTWLSCWFSCPAVILAIPGDNAFFSRRVCSVRGLLGALVLLR